MDAINNGRTSHSGSLPFYSGGAVRTIFQDDPGRVELFPDSIGFVPVLLASGLLSFNHQALNLNFRERRSDCFRGPRFRTELEQPQEEPDLSKGYEGLVRFGSQDSLAQKTI